MPVALGLGAYSVPSSAHPEDLGAIAGSRLCFGFRSSVHARPDRREACLSRSCRPSQVSLAFRHRGVVILCAWCCWKRGNTLSAGGLARGHILPGARSGGSPEGLSAWVPKPSASSCTDRAAQRRLSLLSPVFLARRPWEVSWGSLVGRRPLRT